MLPPDATMGALYAEPTVAAARAPVVMARGVGAGAGVGVGEEGDGSATLRSGEEVQPESMARPERVAKAAKKANLRNAGMRGSPNGQAMEGVAAWFLHRQVRTGSSS